MFPVRSEQLVGLAQRSFAMLHVAGPRADVPDAARGDRVLPLLSELAQVVPIRAQRLERTVELAQPRLHVRMEVERELLHAGDVTEPLDELLGVAHTLLDPPRAPDEVRRPHRRKADLERETARLSSVRSARSSASMYASVSPRQA